MQAPSYVEDVIRMIRLCIEKSVFQWNNWHFKQIEGLLVVFQVSGAIGEITTALTETRKKYVERLAA